MAKLNNRNAKFSYHTRYVSRVWTLTESKKKKTSLDAISWALTADDSFTNEDKKKNRKETHDDGGHGDRSSRQTKKTKKRGSQDDLEVAKGRNFFRHRAASHHFTGHSGPASWGPRRADFRAEHPPGNPAPAKRPGSTTAPAVHAPALHPAVHDEGRRRSSRNSPETRPGCGDATHWCSQGGAKLEFPDGTGSGIERRAQRWDQQSPTAERAAKQTDETPAFYSTSNKIFYFSLGSTKQPTNKTEKSAQSEAKKQQTFFLLTGR